MPYYTQWEDEGVYIQFFDKLTSQDLIESSSKLVADSKYEAAKYIISDFENVSEVVIGIRDLNITTSFTIRVNPYNTNIKVALVSSHQELQALLDKYIIYTLIQIPHAQQRLFENIAEAREWVTS